MEGEHTLISSGACFGNVSTGLMHATPGEMKSFRSSADKIADMLLSPFKGEGTVMIKTISSKANIQSPRVTHRSSTGQWRPNPSLT